MVIVHFIVLFPIIVFIDPSPNECRRMGKLWESIKFHSIQHYSIYTMWNVLFRLNKKEEKKKSKISCRNVLISEFHHDKVISHCSAWLKRMCVFYTEKAFNHIETATSQMKWLPEPKEIAFKSGNQPLNELWQYLFN